MMTEEKNMTENREQGTVERVEKPLREMAPAVDIFENEDRVVILADMPGVEEKDVEATLEADVLTIQGVSRQQEPEGARPVHREFAHSGKFKRTFTLGREINREAIEATVKNGVLKLVLPRIEPERKKIQIKSA